MFGMIPLVITIILASVITISVSYFGGDIFADSTDRANVRKVINQGEQIFNAIKMYQFKEQESPTDIQVDILENTKYYSGGSSGSGSIWAQSGDGLYSTVPTTGECKLINKEIGYDGPVPDCTAVPNDLRTSSKFYCCSNP